MSPSLTKPLQCVTTTPVTTPAPSPNMVLINYLNNPLICGPGVLPSPTLATVAMINEDSNPPALTACHDGLDTASDSGIDDSITENMSPLKRSYEQQSQKVGGQYMNNDKFYDDNIKHELKLNGNGLTMATAAGPPPPPATTIALSPMKQLHEDDEDGATMSKRKRSISFMDSSNPLMTTPFLMDLCNDDYHMIENDIDNVLNVWPEELA